MGTEAPWTCELGRRCLIVVGANAEEDVEEGNDDDEDEED